MQARKTEVKERDESGEHDYGNYVQILSKEIYKTILDLAYISYLKDSKDTNSFSEITTEKKDK